MIKIIAPLIIALGVVSVAACSSSNGSNSPTKEETNLLPTEETPPNQAGSNPPVTNPPNNNQSDGGNDVNVPPPPPKEPTNQAECIAACEATHPNAAALNHELDNTCFFGEACGTVCNNLGQGEVKFPSPAAAAKCDTSSTNGYDIGVPSQACADCLASTPVCCSLWVNLFGSQEGRSLSECAHDCWNTFPN